MVAPCLQLLRDGALVVLCGLDGAPNLRWHMETLLHNPPYIYLNGVWQDTAGTLVTVVQKSLSCGDTTPFSQVSRGDGRRLGELDAMAGCEGLEPDTG